MKRLGNVWIGNISEIPNPTTTRLRAGMFFIDEVAGTTYILKTLSGTGSWYSVGSATEYSF